MKPGEESRHAESAEAPPMNNRHRGESVIPPAVLMANSLWKGRIFTAAELMAQEFPAVRWAVPKVIPQGVTILAGKPKMGKGWFLLGVGVAISTGGVALGKVPVEQGDCLYLALEDNRRRLQGRLDKLLMDARAPVHLHVATEWPRLDEGGVEELDDWLAIHPDARAVFIDTLKKVRPRTSGNKSLYDVDYEALEPLIPLAADHGVAIVVVHHTRKLAAADALDEISGSTGLSGGADGVLVLKRERGRADAYLHVTGREIEEEAELALRWDQNTAGWTIVGDADEYRLNEERAEVLRVLEEAGEPIGPRDVADALGADYNATRQRLYQMGRSGEVEVVGRGRYSIPNNPNKPNNQLGEDSSNVRDVRNVRDDHEREVLAGLDDFLDENEGGTR
jgi:hypothetical protein